MELTATEHRIAQLVAAGRSNREVAGQLFVNVKTVERTLSRIYPKLSVRSHTELAAKAAAGQIASSSYAVLSLVVP